MPLVLRFSFGLVEGVFTTIEGVFTTIEGLFTVISEKYNSLKPEHKVRIRDKRYLEFVSTDIIKIGETVCDQYLQHSLFIDS